MSLFLNYTPHTVRVYSQDGKTCLYEFTTHGTARVKQISELQGHLDGVPLTTTQYGEIEGLPNTPPQDAEGNKCYIVVSSIVLDAARRLNHPLLAYLCVPDTGPESVVRDAQNQILGVRRMIIAG